jgi:hypothetical protein
LLERYGNSKERVEKEIEEFEKACRVGAGPQPPAPPLKGGSGKS